MSKGANSVTSISITSRNIAKNIRTGAATAAFAATLTLSMLTAPAHAQETDISNCPETGLTVTSNISGDIPLGGPLALSSRNQLDRDVVMEESIERRLASLGYKIDDSAFWQLVYETDSTRPPEDRRFSINSQVQGGRQPEALGRYKFDSNPDGCGPLSVYTIAFEILDEGARVVWRGNATNHTNTTSPVADKERLTERLISALRSDLRETHNLSGRN